MIAALRTFDLNESFEQVVARSNLRAPQEKSLSVIHQVIKSLPAPLREMEAAQIAERAKEIDPNWLFSNSRLELTFALATGVGKTRLMGAIAAYLFRASESRNFLFLAPRDQILRKLVDELRQTDPKYVFSDKALVPQPQVCRKDNLLEFVPNLSDGILDGPNVFVLSPQIFTAGGRIDSVSPFLGKSVREYLEAADDLIVFVDESHHLSSSDKEKTANTWADALHGLEPKGVFSMTATPRGGVDIGFEYSLRQCLRERLYTKAVRLIVDDQADGMAGVDYDRYTLDAALARLEAKKSALDLYREKNHAFPDLTPVLLVCAHDTNHANEVERWLIEGRGFEEDEVLAIHSKKRSEKDLEALAKLEEPGSPVRVVVQVHVLDEGWDVTNVWVIAPLRNVNSFVNARQVMGRGMRLPLGSRCGAEELDTLDVLAFGQQTVSDIIVEATAEFGDDSGLRIVETGAELEDGDQTIQSDDEPEPGTRRIRVDVVAPDSLVIPVIPLLDFRPRRPDLGIEIESLALAAGGLSGLDLDTFDTKSIDGFGIEREEFVQQTVSGVLRDFFPAGYPLQAEELEALVRDALNRTVGDDCEVVPLDPRRVAVILLDALRAAYAAVEPAFQLTGLDDTLEILPQEIMVSEKSPEFIPKPAEGWSADLKRKPISGWQRCTHAAARFDTKPEYDLACRLDSMNEVQAWVRNDPAHLSFETTDPVTKSTAPDFLVFTSDGEFIELMMIEVKGGMLWSPGSSAEIHAQDVACWCRTANEHPPSNQRYWSGVVLDEDVEPIATLADLKSVARNTP